MTGGTGKLACIVAAELGLLNELLDQQQLSVGLREKLHPQNLVPFAVLFRIADQAAREVNPLTRAGISNAMLLTES